MFIATPIPKKLKPQRSEICFAHCAPTELGAIRLVGCYKHPGPPGLSPTTDANAKSPSPEAMENTRCLTA